jgi:DNA processing protein
VQIKIDDAGYPTALRSLPNPPLTLKTSGPLARRRAVAIVGSRRASEEALSFAYELAFQLAAAGVVVVSGGAVGVDGAAHRGALAAGGATWVVSPTGKARVYPSQHRELFAEIAASSASRMIWSFPDAQSQTRETLRYRNGILAALTEAMVVVQAHFASGSRNAAAWARAMGRPVWAVTASPWMLEFSGSLAEIEHGTAQPLCSAAQLFAALRLPSPVRVADGAYRPQKHCRAPFSRGRSKGSLDALDMRGWSADEKLIFSKVFGSPLHVDQIADRAALPAGSTVTALLTLSLKDVVVEGPGGFFRRRPVT